MSPRARLRRQLRRRRKLHSTPSRTPFRPRRPAPTRSASRRAAPRRLLPGTTKQQSVHVRREQPGHVFLGGRLAGGAAARSGGHGQLQPVPRSLSVHGTLRNQTEYCVLCHNPSNTDAHARQRAQSRPTRRCRRRASTSTCWCTASTTARICWPTTHLHRRRFRRQPQRFHGRPLPGDEPDRARPATRATAPCATSTAASRICRRA